MTNREFFDESLEQSSVKSNIVAKYFWAWAKVVIPTAKKKGNRIAYIDLFAGPGRYLDGTKSTPILLLEKAVEDRDLSQMLVALFNDKDENHTRSLEAAIKNIPGIEKLKFKPVVRNQDVGTEIVSQFQALSFVPTLFFVDPWGYKGLSLDLVNSVLKNWGCDCIFFFNYNRINPGLSNPAVESHMNALFGKERADELRIRLNNENPNSRELMIIEELCKALGADSRRFVLPFRFVNERGTRTTHHLIFVSKDFKGYEIMKEIMAKESSSRDQGVPNFEYNPADKRFPHLFELTAPLDDLEDSLLETYAGRTLSRAEIYRGHSVGKPYIKSNYRDALLKMEERELIQCSPPLQKRRKGTLGENVMASFPRQN